MYNFQSNRYQLSYFYLVHVKRKIGATAICAPQEPAPGGARADQKRLNALNGGFRQAGWEPEASALSSFLHMHQSDNMI